MAHIIENGIARGKLRLGITIGAVTHKDFEMRQASLGDMLDAEAATPGGQPLAYTVELVCHQLVKVGNFEGPFTAGQLRKLPPDDWETLNNARTGLIDSAKNGLSDSGED